MNVDTGEIKPYKELTAKQIQSGKWVECKIEPSPDQKYKGIIQGWEKCLCGNGKQFKN